MFMEWREKIEEDAYITSLVITLPVYELHTVSLSSSVRLLIPIYPPNYRTSIEIKQ
jgi:hypothetical protein